MVFQRILLVSFLFALPYLSAISQSITPSVLSSGQITETSNGYYVSSTIGQLITPTATNGNYTVTQGFQQPGFDVNTFIQGIIYSQVDVKAYPNPFTRFITIEANESTISRVRFYDIEGRIVFSKDYKENSLQIVNTSNLSVGNYTMEIIGSTETQRTYINIIKQ